MMKIVTIVGARPQFIKAAVVSRAIVDHNQKNPENPIREIIIHTGQHYDANMSDVFFDEMKIPRPEYNLNINGMGHGAMTGQMLEKIEFVLIKEKPDWVLIYGDTNSTLAGALAAKKLHIKLAHVEAGLRSFNMQMPEEINRILSDRISDVLFCPTIQAVENLKKEGFENFHCKMNLCGDVMYDAALFYRKLAKAPSFNLREKFALVTIHRAENTDDPDRLLSIIKALNQVSQVSQVILPLHPRTRQIIKNAGLQLSFEPVDPVGYLEMIYLLERASLVMTDSGGLQKEACFFHKPCITLRDQTEWTELVDLGYNFLAGAATDNILRIHKKLQDIKIDFSDNPYGDGNAGNKIIEYLARYEVFN